LAIGANGQCSNRLPGTGEDPCPVHEPALPDALDPTYLDTIATLRQHLASSRARVDELLAAQARRVSLAPRGEVLLQELNNAYIDLRSFTGDGSKEDRERAARAAYKMENALNAIEDLVREACRG